MARHRQPYGDHLGTRAHRHDVATRAEAARQSEELKSTMLDALAHEFKTPLTPHQGGSDFYAVRR